MTFLSGIIATIIEKLFGSLLDWLKTQKSEWDAKRSIEKKEQDSVQKLKDAKTGQEIDDAADDALSGL